LPRGLGRFGDAAIAISGKCRVDQAARAGNVIIGLSLRSSQSIIFCEKADEGYGAAIMTDATTGR